MRTFGLLGFPLSHSFSKNYFEEKFRNENKSDCCYQNFAIEQLDLLPTILRNNPTLEGLNVTIPYKEKVLNYLDEIDKTAAQIGAVNTIQIKGGKLKGYNTDVLGFIQSIQPLLKPHHSLALVLGTGGSAKAVLFGLQKLKIPFHTVSQEREKADFIYADLQAETMAAHSIVINTTPLGMFPAIETAPDIPYPYIGEQHLLFDLIYNPAETLFLRLGKEQGATIKNGLEMLQIQAKESWKIWEH